MNHSIIGTLEQQRRDALVAYYLGHLAQRDYASTRIATENDLYEYLLIDNQVSADVDTSRVAQGIASIQQHVHAIYNGMEPGYSGVDAQVLNLWREGMSQYSLWAGYQMLEDYPENYLDPTLRLDKTEMFKTFESELAQARLTEDTVQIALGNYLQAFESVSNLMITGCYVDSANFLDADYYFVARQRTEPFAFYWRKARMYAAQDDVSARMAAWTEWKPISSVSGEHVKFCRPVVMNGRLYVVWAQSGQGLLTDSADKIARYEYKLQLTYRRLDDSWSPPVLLHKGEAPNKMPANTENASGVVTSGYRLAVSTDFEGLANSPRLLVMFKSIGLTDGAQVDHVSVRDQYLNVVQLDDDARARVADVLQTMLGDDNRRVQFNCAQLTGEETNWKIVSVVPKSTGEGTNAGKLSGHLELSAQWLNGKVRLQGFCKRSVSEVAGIAFSFSATESVIFRWVYVMRVRTVGDEVWFYVEISDNDDAIPQSQSLTLKYKGKVVCQLTSADFVWVPSDLSPYKKYRADKKVGIVKDYLDIAALQGVFSVTVADNAFHERDLDDKDNYFRPAMMTSDMDWAIHHYCVTTVLTGRGLVLNGDARTTVYDHSWPSGADGSTDGNIRTYQFGGNNADQNIFGLDVFTVTRAAVGDPAPLVSTTVDGAQYLDFRGAEIDTPLVVRLNTLFAKELSSKASLSLESALSWETQHTIEPALPTQTAPVYVDFGGANGLYFWELFFHAPHLVAWRLNQEFDYYGAQRWLQRLFNPQMRVAALYPPPARADWMPYWTCRPLSLKDDIALEIEGPTDPDAIAKGAPSHYRKAIFMLYLDNLIAWGDMLYRQVTRDTLNEAKLHYVRALSLLGPLSKGRSISRWDPVPLSEAGAANTRSLAAIESANLELPAPSLPVAQGAILWQRLLGAENFRLPVNSRLLDVWDRLDVRLYNLRHNLTLDGKPMQLALYEAPANPLDLLRAQLNGSGLNQRRLGSLAVIPPYRFRAMLPRVQNAVEVLTRFGQQVLTFMEFRDRARQDELQQGHLLDDLKMFAEQLQQDAVDQAQKGCEALQASRTGAVSRKSYYDSLIKTDVSRLEKAAHSEQLTAMGSMVVARELGVAGHVANLAANLVGGATGGMIWGSAAFAAAERLEGMAAVAGELAQQQLTSDMQIRRRAEWSFLSGQAAEDIALIDAQIEVQNKIIKSANTSLKQSVRAREQAEELYAFIKNRSAGAGLYQWLLSQMSTLYFQAYDAVLSLCLSTEACWQYEIGDMDTRFISTTAWADNRFGLTAGETLKLGLVQMEAAFLARNERRLEVTKTISLKELLSVGSGADSRDWAQVLETLRSDGQIIFGLKSSTFDKDYPGHYLRQIARLSVSLPVVLPPYQDLHATLSQQSSSYLLKPQIDNVRHLYKQSGDLPDQADTRQDQLVFNPCSNQQIGLSTGVDDHGMFQVDFGDERYFPFEGTGAISSWTLSFANHESEAQQAMFDTLNDIILHVRYLAVDGGQSFAAEVAELVDAVEDAEGKQAVRRQG